MPIIRVLKILFIDIILDIYRYYVK